MKCLLDSTVTKKCESIPFKLTLDCFPNTGLLSIYKDWIYKYLRNKAISNFSNEVWEIIFTQLNVTGNVYSSGCPLEKMRFSEGIHRYFTNSVMVDLLTRCSNKQDKTANAMLLNQHTNRSSCFVIYLACTWEPNNVLLFHEYSINASHRTASRQEKL